MALDAVQQALAVDRASVLLFDDNGVMRFRAWTGLSDEYRRTVDGHSPWRLDTVNPTPVLVPDVERTPGMDGYREAFRREQIRALAFIPLSTGRRTIGKFMLYWDAPHELDAASLDAARALGALMTLAMERHARDLESRQREQHILFALDAANMGTWQWEVKSGQVHWSQNMERLHGLAPGTFDGAFDSYLAEIHPEDRGRVLASATRALREGATHDVEYRIVSPEGVVRWVHGKGRVEYDEAGVAARMSGVCMDVSARKTVEIENATLFARAESALEREAGARERLTRLAEGSRALLGSLDAASIGDDVLALARQSIAADGYAVWRVKDHRLAGGRQRRHQRRLRRPAGLGRRAHADDRGAGRHHRCRRDRWPGTSPECLCPRRRARVDLGSARGARQGRRRHRVLLPRPARAGRHRRQDRAGARPPGGGRRSAAPNCTPNSRRCSRRQSRPRRGRACWRRSAST